MAAEFREAGEPLVFNKLCKVTKFFPCFFFSFLPCAACPAMNAMKIKRENEREMWKGKGKGKGQEWGRQ